MKRIAIFLLFAVLGFMLAVAGDAAPVLPGPPPAPAATEFEVPLSWIAEALSGMPFVLPAGR